MIYLYKLILFFYFSMYNGFRHFGTKIFRHNAKIKLHHSQYNIISNTNNKSYNIKLDKDEYINQNEFIQNKKIISISPGGYKGVYMLGICIYIKDNFNLDEFIFSGASAGAWNSLMLCCKKDVTFFKTDIVDYSIKNSKTIFELEYLIVTLKIVAFITVLLSILLPHRGHTMTIL